MKAVIVWDNGDQEQMDVADELADKMAHWISQKNRVVPSIQKSDRETTYYNVDKIRSIEIKKSWTD